MISVNLVKCNMNLRASIKDMETKTAKANAE